jgi:hypothetical protein
VELLLPQPLVLLSGILLLVGGILSIPMLLPLAGLDDREPVWRKFSVVILGMGSLMVIRFLHSLMTAPKNLTENLYPLFLALLLSFIIASLQEPIARVRRKWFEFPSTFNNWTSVVISWILGGSVFLLQIIVLN